MSTATVEVIKGLSNEQLLLSYDQVVIERKRLQNALGGRMVSGDDARRIEDLTEKINAMRFQIFTRMEG